MDEHRGPFHVHDGMRRSDVFQNMMTYGLFTGPRVSYGAEKVGALIIRRVREQQRQIQVMQISEPRRYTSFQLRPAPDPVFEEVGVDPARQTAHPAFLGAEPHSENAEKIEEFYGSRPTIPTACRNGRAGRRL
jgi:phenylacetate-CoA ligase